MKTFKLLISCLILSGLVTSSLLSQEKAVIKIDLDRKIGVVDSNIYGAFLESMVAYGGIYDPSSKFADENGFRKDFIDLMKELDIPVVRWPGGNVVSGYNWMDGIGPKDQRPSRMELAWHSVETNQMGTDEYVRFCGLIGAENFVCINAGTGTLDDARHWVEYCNYPKGTYYSDLRRKNGNEEPYKIKYWALGNEIDGPWQMGQKNAEDYVKFALEAGKLIRLVDKDVKLIASGASDYNPENHNKWIGWNDYVLENMAGSIDYISVHRYVTEALKEDKGFASQMSLSLDLDRKIELIKGQIAKAVTKSGTDRPIYISFDEYGSRGNTLTGSLMLAMHLNSFIRHADIVKMANLTMITSLAGSSPEGVFKNTFFYPFYLYSHNSHGTALDVFTDCQKYSNEIFSDIPYLDVTATHNEAAKVVVLNVVNRHETNAIASDIVLQSGSYAGTAKVSEINGPSIDASNSPAKEDVGIVTKDIKFKGNTINYSFPAHSLTQIEIPVR